MAGLTGTAGPVSETPAGSCCAKGQRSGPASRDPLIVTASPRRTGNPDEDCAGACGLHLPDTFSRASRCGRLVRRTRPTTLTCMAAHFRTSNGGRHTSTRFWSTWRLTNVGHRPGLQGVDRHIVMVMRTNQRLGLGSTLIRRSVSLIAGQAAGHDPQATVTSTSWSNWP